MKYLAKKYSWGYSVWIKLDIGKRQIAKKLKDKDAVMKFINEYEIEWK